jgi:Flp pilus assembly protein TadG
MLPALSSRFRARLAATGFRRTKGEEGSGLVEYALIFILFITMILGIMDFCRMLYAYHFVSNAAREATRWASVNGSTCNGDAISGSAGSCTAPVTCGSSGCSTCTSYGSCSPANSTTDIPNYVEMLAIPAGINTSSGCGSTGNSACLTTTPTWPVQTTSPTSCSTTVNGPGCTVQVQVSYSFNFLFPLVHISPVTLSSTSEMVIVH